MALKFSTGLRDMLLGKVPIRSVATMTAATIAAVDGGGGADSFTDSGNGFLTAGFSVGDAVMVYGFTGGMAAIHGPFTLTSVAAGTMEVATGLLAADAAGETVTIVALVGGSLRDIFKDGILYLYSGSQPSDADQAAVGSQLVKITDASGAWAAGAVANGLEFGIPSSGSVAKKSAQVWSGVGLIAGTMGWFRLCANPTDALTLSTTLPRIDGSIGTSGANLNMSSTSVAVGATITIDTFTISLAANA